MGTFIDRVDAWVLALGFSAAMFAAWRVGWRRARRFPAESAQDPGSKFTDASMALLGLLLGFTFSMSLGKHDQRRAKVVDDSNAIGDFYTCASLLKEPRRGKLQAVIRDYAEKRIAVTRGSRSEEDLEEAAQRFDEMHTRMTEIVADSIGEGTPIAVPLTNTLNEVTSSYASRFAAYRDRLPWIIVLLLFLASVVPAFLMGQQQGTSQKPNVTGTFSFIFLVNLVIYVSLDLNQPRSGAITVSQEPIERLVKSMSK
jgi:hypothetical protein